MTVEFSPSLERRFIRNGLPWIVGAGALAFYLATLNHWITLTSLGQVVRVSGWEWPASPSQPLTFVLTYPFHWLPFAWVPLALNAFTAVCASLTLVLLARSVALLPHDRVEQQRLLVGNAQGLLSTPDAWVPVVLAAGALGLQLTFWEHSIAATGEMLDLLLVAYCIRCLLEHRLDQRNAWLDRAALVYGLAMANNWAMAGFLPLFIVALLRTKRMTFFNLRYLRRLEQVSWETIAPVLGVDVRFFLRIALLGLAGMSLFLILPLVQSFSPGSPFGFGEAARAVAVVYKNNLYMASRAFLRSHREISLLLAATSLLPVFLLSIRWGAFAPAAGPARFDLASFILHAAHAFLLAICLWALFDPPFSPRQIGMACLPLYYLAALSVGYYSGFLLLLFGRAALQRLSRRERARRALCMTVPYSVYVAAVLALAGLLLKNLPVIRAAAAPHLERYAALMTRSLPREGGVLFSEDPVRLVLAQATLAKEGKAGRFMPLVQRGLLYAKYRAWLKRKYPQRWLANEPQGILDTPSTNGMVNAGSYLQLMANLTRSNRVYCLQPNPTFLLEWFCWQPLGLAHEMKLYPTNSLIAPRLTPSELAENQAFWQRAIQDEVQPLSRLLALSEVPRPEFEQWLMQKAHLKTPPPAQWKVLGRWYSSALNVWGATLQRNGLWKEASPCFALAVDLNPDNLPARLNLACNSNWLAHVKIPIDATAPLKEQFEKYRDGGQVVAENGPFEEPSYCYLMGVSFARAGLGRQAVQQLERVRALAPGELVPRLLLSELYARCRLPDQALDLIAGIRSDPQFQPLNRTNEVELALLEAQIWYAKTNQSKAEAVINALLAAHPDDPAIWDQAGAIYTAHRSYTNALRVVRQQLQRAPDNVAALMNQGSLLTIMGDYSNAIPSFTHALSLTNIESARFSRGLVYLQSGQLKEAEADFRELVRAFPSSYRAYNALGEIAWRKGETNAAVDYYREYLAHAPAEAAERPLIIARLRSLSMEWP